MLLQTGGCSHGGHAMTSRCLCCQVKLLIDDWIKRLLSVCEGYAPENIFNTDETGLFFRALPTKSMVAKGDSCKGGKVAKERVTVLLCCSAKGEKIQPLVIGLSPTSPTKKPG